MQLCQGQTSLCSTILWQVQTSNLFEGCCPPSLYYFGLFLAPSSASCVQQKLCYYKLIVIILEQTEPRFFLLGSKIRFHLKGLKHLCVRVSIVSTTLFFALSVHLKSWHWLFPQKMKKLHFLCFPKFPCHQICMWFLWCLTYFWSLCEFLFLFGLFKLYIDFFLTD